MMLSLRYLTAFLYATLLLCSISACQLIIEPNYLSTPANFEDKASAVCSCSDNSDVNYKFTWYRHGHLLVNTDRVELEATSPDRIFFRRILVEDKESIFVWLRILITLSVLTPLLWFMVS